MLEDGDTCNSAGSIDGEGRDDCGYGSDGGHGVVTVRNVVSIVVMDNGYGSDDLWRW